MATKLSADLAKRIKALGIAAKDEETARPKLLKILDKEGINGMEDEDISTIVEIAESFVEDAPEVEEEDTEEDEMEELAEEVEEEEEDEKPAKKPAAKKSSPAKKAPVKVEEPEEEEEDEETEEEEDFDLSSLDRNELKTFIKENDLDITVKKSMTDDDIREAIEAALEGEEEEEVEEAPAPKKSAKKEVTPAASKKSANPAKKETSKKEAKAPSKRGTKLDPKNNEEDREAFDIFNELFPIDKFIYAWVASAGVTIKNKGTNSNRSLVLIENASKKADDTITCNLYLLLFKGKLEAVEAKGIEFEKSWDGAPLIKGITLEEAAEIIEQLIDEMTASVNKIDKKLGDNRKKMEENLDKTKKSTPAKKSTKKVEEVEEVEEEEDEEEEAPAPKKTTKKVAAPAKKTAPAKPLKKAVKK